MKTVFDLIRCPLCGARLTREGGSLVCGGEPRRHVYDLSSSGYVNLLPPGKKNNAVTGDRRDLIAARSSFLDSGRYAPLSDAVAAAASALPGDADEFCFADFGCGEGYHTCRVASALAAEGRRVVALGIDASKYAAESGAKRAKRAGFPAPFEVGAEESTVSFIAGNFFHPPIFPSSLPCVTTMFAPIAFDAAAAALSGGGGIVAAVSGADHLFELREMIYRDVERRSEDVSVPDGFEIREKTNVRYTASLSAEQTASLFGMTPFFCRAPAEARERVLSHGAADVTVDVNVYTILKKD